MEHIREFGFVHEPFVFLETVIIREKRRLSRSRKVNNIMCNLFTDVDWGFEGQIFSGVTVTVCTLL